MTDLNTASRRSRDGNAALVSALVAAHGDAGQNAEAARIAADNAAIAERFQRDRERRLREEAAQWGAILAAPATATPAPVAAPAAPVVTPAPATTGRVIPTPAVPADWQPPAAARPASGTPAPAAAPAAQGTTRTRRISTKRIALVVFLVTFIVAMLVGMTAGFWTEGVVTGVFAGLATWWGLWWWNRRE